MVSGVITGVWRRWRASTHDAPGPPVARSRRRHGVFAIETAPGRRKQTLPVAEHHAILAVGERSALAAQFIVLPALARQLSVVLEGGCVAALARTVRGSGFLHGAAKRCIRDCAR